MIESKDVLALCDHFGQYLLPLDIHVLPQRYNAETFRSTYAVAREMHISDETVRTIENRTLDAIVQCLDLAAAGQDITSMRVAKSFRQLMASMICNGFTKTVTAAGYRAHCGELTIFASSRWRPRDCPRSADGAIAGRYPLMDCYRTHLTYRPHPHKWRLVLEQREAFPELVPYSGEPAFFRIHNAVAKQLLPRYECRYNAGTSHE